MSNKLLTLALVIPAYNEEGHLKDCLDAVASQTVKPDRVIVVNNNSTDATVRIARSYKFVTLIHEKVQGIAQARTAGYNEAREDLIGRIDADTVLPPDWVARVKKFYANPEHKDVSLTGGGYFYNLRLKRFNGWVFSQLAFRMNRFIVGYYILWGSNMVLPNQVWQAVKSTVCDDYYIHEDLDLAIHLHRLDYKITYDAKLRVGVYMKRVYDGRETQNEHLSRWPKTLKSHKFPYWWLSLIGNVLIKYVLQPFAILTEGIAILFGRGRKKSALK